MTALIRLRKEFLFTIGVLAGSYSVNFINFINPLTKFPDAKTTDHHIETGRQSKTVF